MTLGRNASRVDVLALRRRLLVARACLQRMQLRSDLQVFEASIEPLPALASGLLGHLRGRGSLIALAGLGALLLRLPGVRRGAARALMSGCAWAALRRWFVR